MKQKFVFFALCIVPIACAIQHAKAVSLKQWSQESALSIHRQPVPTEDGCINPPAMGKPGQMIVIDSEVRGRDYSQVSVSQFQGAYQQSKIFFVHREKLLSPHLDKKTEESLPSENQKPSTEAGLIRYRYFLSGSSLTYTFCIGSKQPVYEDATILIFNDEQKYKDFQDDPKSGAILSVAQKKATIGIGSRKCTTMTYDTSINTNLFITVLTPANISFNYIYSPHRYFYNESDYTSRCNVSSSSRPCEASLTEGMELSLLAYIIPPVDESWYSTWFCVKGLRDLMP